MVSNLERYKNDLDRLVKNGEQLLHSIQQKSDPEFYQKNWSENDIEGLPNFLVKYQIWYSEALKIIKIIIPNREQDFIRLYKQPSNRKQINGNNYAIEDYLNQTERLTGLEKTSLLIQSIDYNKKSLNPIVKDMITGSIEFTKATLFKYNQQLAILKSANTRFESSLFEIKRLLQADLFDSELEAAKELNKKGFDRGAGAIAGVVLEGHLKEVCHNHKIKITKKNPTINDLNQLLKDNETIDMAQWRYIQRLADLRNLCNHKKETDPTKEKVSELIEGVEKTIKTLF